MYRRPIQPAEPLTGEALVAAMVGIGMNLAANGARNPNIEDTLLFASREALAKQDTGVLSALTTWLGIHSNWVNADRLTRLVAEQEPRIRAFWAAAGHWLKPDRRFARLSGLYRGHRVDVLPAGAELEVNRHGEDLRFAGSPLRVPANLLAARDAEVLSPGDLAKRHCGYRQRVLMGPSYRADMWGLLLAQPSLSAAELARRTYGSFATAWQVKRDWELLKGTRAVPHESGAAVDRSDWSRGSASSSAWTAEID
jgi:hypothetical protein